MYSIATLNLVINSTTTSNTNLNSCESVNWNGQTYSSSGNYSHFTTNSNGCDSIANLNLTISSSSTTTNISLDVCNEYY